MNKRMRTAVCGLLCLLLTLLPFGGAICAAETAAAAESAAQTEEPAALTISTAEEFLEFAEACRLDSYSRGLTVSLEADLDLTGLAFEGIPIFCGTFRGNSHTIRGVELTAVGSVQGLFRYLTQEAVVKGLSVAGRVAPGGSQAVVGGIAGENAGRIEACSFYGSVAGGEQVGGIAGINTVTGMIENCRMSGTLQGRHFVGGIAGENAGVIRGCTNNASVNAAAGQNAVELEDITMETLTGAEAANTVTDIGGIAGSSRGVIRRCENKGDVGYPHIGYNMGGIAGSQTGYITDCVNHGQISGRKEAGGIVGQLEPVARFEFSEDALQTLQGQLETVSRTADRAAANAQSNAAGLQQQLNTLRGHASDAASLAEQLRPKLDLQDPELPDWDNLLALRSSLTDSMTALSDTAGSVVADTRNAAETLTADLQALAEQMEEIEATLRSAPENLGGSVTDVSDLDTEEDTTAKVENCRNLGEVNADLNVGGIVGAMAPENDLDPEEDLSIGGSASLNFAGELRAVVRGCVNAGRITVKRQSAGGIAGWQSMGLVRECCSTGALEASGAEQVGGIAGKSDGYLRACSANCAIAGGSNVGGIAGSGAIVTDCRSMVQITGGSEKTGAVLGEANAPYVEAETPRSGNLYLPVGEDRGGIDGISYAGIAEPLSLEAFLALEELDEMFRYVTLFFTFADGTEQSVRLPVGSTVTAKDLPELPEQPGYAARWVCQEGEDLTEILFDRHFTASYTGYDKVVASEQTDADGAPLLLVMGDFSTAVTVDAEDTAVTGELPPLEERESVLLGRTVSVSEPESLRTGRMLLPRDVPAAQLRLWAWDGWGWKNAEFTVDGSYAVFAMNGSEQLLVLTQTVPIPWTYIGAAGAAVLLVLCGSIAAARKKRKKKTQKPSA